MIKVYFLNDWFFIFDTQSAKNCIFECGVYGNDLSYFCSLINKKSPSKLPISLTYYEYYYLIIKYEKIVETYEFNKVENKWQKKNVLIKNIKEKYDLNKCKVYSELRNRGYYVTTGENFGCDFLVYSSCVLTSHADYILKIYTYDKDIEYQNILCYTRLATCAKKQFIIAKIKTNNLIEFICYNFDKNYCLETKINFLKSLE